MGAIKSQIKKKENFIQSAAIAKRVRLNKYNFKQCVFCEEEKVHIQIKHSICLECVEKLNAIPLVQWKKMKNTAFASRNLKKGKMLNQMFKFRRAGKLFGIDSLPTKGQIKAQNRKKWEMKHPRGGNKV